MKRIFCLCAGLVVVVFLSVHAFADEFHYNSVLIGDRASGMGGAYTAISDDATGLYYNPAGIVYSSGKNLSASVNAFYNQTKTYKKAIAGYDWERNSSALLPNYFGIIQPLGNYRFGFSYAVPDTINEDQDQTFDNVPAVGDTYIINFNNDDNTYNFGPSFAFEIGKDLSAGITLYVHQRKAQFILNQLITFSGSTFEWTSTYFELNEWGVRPIMGIAWSPAEKISLGLSVSQAFILSSKASRQETCSDSTLGGCDNNTSTNDAFFRFEGRSNEERKYPARVGFGAAYFASNTFLITGDLTYYTKVTDPIFGNKEPVLNLALGTEYYLDKEWAVRGGFYTNMANTPEIQSGVTSVEEHINIYGGTLSLSHFTRNTSVTLGGSVSSGSGKSQITGGLNAQDASTFGWTISLSSSYSY
jgi:long-chain fatty acid transport protein